MNYASLEELYHNSSEDFRKKNAELFRDINKSSAPKEKGKNKYNNKKVTVDGVTYDSTIEYNRWCQLKLLEQGGHILYLQRQVSFELFAGYTLDGEKIRSMNMIIDATYTQDGQKIAEDTKGMKPTRDWLNKAKMFKQLYPEYKLLIYTKDGIQ